MKQVPPGPPVAVELGEGCRNAALLSWKPPVPAPDTAYTYQLERQEVGTDTWVQCLTTEGASAVEVPGDNVPNEGDYRFRLSVVSEHGQSPYVLFPGSVHLGENPSILIPQSFLPLLSILCPKPKPYRPALTLMTASHLPSAHGSGAKGPTGCMRARRGRCYLFP